MLCCSLFVCLCVHLSLSSLLLRLLLWPALSVLCCCCARHSHGPGAVKFDCPCMAGPCMDGPAAVQQSSECRPSAMPCHATSTTAPAVRKSAQNPAVDCLATSPHHIPADQHRAGLGDAAAVKKTTERVCVAARYRRTAPLPAVYPAPGRCNGGGGRAAAACADDEGLDAQGRPREEEKQEMVGSPPRPALETHASPGGSCSAL
jgi:hypothetical protein